MARKNYPPTRRQLGSVAFTSGSLKQTTSPVTPNNFTVCAWCQITSSVASFAILDVDDGTTHFCGLYSSGSNATIGAEADGNSGTTPLFGAANSSPILNLWYFVFFISGTSWIAGGRQGPSGPWTTSTASGTAGTTGSAWVGNDGFGDGLFPGLIAGAKWWNRQLSIAEVLRESEQLSPVTSVGLVSYLPLFSSSAANYDSANAGLAPWTITGTLSQSATSPPVPEVLVRRIQIYIPPASATGLDESSVPAGPVIVPNDTIPVVVTEQYVTFVAEVPCEDAVPPPPTQDVVAGPATYVNEDFPGGPFPFEELPPPPPPLPPLFASPCPSPPEDSLGFPFPFEEVMPPPPPTQDAPQPFAYPNQEDSVGFPFPFDEYAPPPVVSVMQDAPAPVREEEIAGTAVKIEDSIGPALFTQDAPIVVNVQVPEEIAQLSAPTGLDEAGPPQPPLPPIFAPPFPSPPEDSIGFPFPFDEIGGAVYPTQDAPQPFAYFDVEDATGFPFPFDESPGATAPTQDAPQPNAYAIGEDQVVTIDEWGTTPWWSPPAVVLPELHGEDVPVISAIDEGPPPAILWSVPFDTIPSPPEETIAGTPVMLEEIPGWTWPVVIPVLPCVIAPHEELYGSRILVNIITLTGTVISPWLSGPVVKPVLTGDVIWPRLGSPVI